MEFNKIFSFVANNIVRNSFGCVLVTETQPKMNKRGNDLYGRVTKRTTSINVALGRDYENRINKDLERNGLAPMFHVERPSGRHVCDKQMFFEQSDTDADKFYLRVMYNPNSKVTTEWFVDGRAATDAEIEIIKSFLPKAAPSAKQMACGLSAEKTETFRSYLTTSIVSIKQGEKVLK